MKFKTTEDYIRAAKERHNNKFNYSKTKYTGLSNKITIICPDHGEFTQTAYRHLTNQTGCTACGVILRAKNRKINAGKKFITRSNKIHNNKYDYSITQYKDVFTPVDIICPIHGKFSQRPNDHLNNHGCYYCGVTTSIHTSMYNIEDVIEKAKIIWGNRFDYSNIKNYRGLKYKYTIKCNQCNNFFKQSLVSNINNSTDGCPTCRYKHGWRKSTWISFCNNRLNSEPKVYIVRLFNDVSKENFIKIGITSDIKLYRRFSRIPYDYEVIQEIKGSPGFVFDKEKELHRKYKDFKYSPEKPFGGQFECFNISILKDFTQSDS